MSVPDPLDLNQLVSLPQEKQSVSLLKWLAECESFLETCTEEEVTQHQLALQQALLNLLNLPTPPLGRVLRNCLGRCFSEIFEKGDRRLLFDTVSTLLQKINQFKADKEAKQKQYDSWSSDRSYYLVQLYSALAQFLPWPVTVSSK